MPRRLLGFLVLAVGSLLLAAAPAFASLADEVAAGRSVAAKLQAGTASCSTLSDAELEHLGEYAMERMAGSPGAHAAMNRRMAQAIGAGSTERMHRLIGRSFAGCATTGGVPMGPGMMSAPAWGWMHNGSWQRMSQADWRRLSGSMMGSAHDGWSTTAVIATILGVLAVAALLALALARRPRRRPPQPLVR